jgi:hypothetical protein
MLKTINDYGLEVIAIGQKGSLARLSCERQKLVDALADCIHAGAFPYFESLLDRESFSSRERDYISREAHHREREMDPMEFADWATDFRNAREKRRGHASL